MYSSVRARACTKDNFFAHRAPAGGWREHPAGGCVMALQLPQITRQRATKLQDFVAHASTVNSVFIGRKSGTLMATGGDDKKVNIWSIGKPNCIASITGHQSAVESVALDANEQTVVAGSAGGTVKMWDLERQRSWAEKSGLCSAAR